MYQKGGRLGDGEALCSNCSWSMNMNNGEGTSGGNGRRGWNLSTKPAFGTSLIYTSSYYHNQKSFKYPAPGVPRRETYCETLALTALIFLTDSLSVSSLCHLSHHQLSPTRRRSTTTKSLTSRAQGNSSQCRYRGSTKR